MTDILPVGGLGDGAGVGSAALGAFGGALIGSWFGDAWAVMAGVIAAGAETAPARRQPVSALRF